MELLVELLAGLDEEGTLAIVRERLDSGDNPSKVLDACREGMTLVGKRFESGEYFLSDLIMAGELFKQVSNIVTPHLVAGQSVAAKGKVVIGTVKGDIHDIGKDIVVTMLRGANYEVEDLGVDVPTEKFVEAVKQTGATVVGLSGLLTIAFDPMKETVVALKEAGLDVKVMIGGGPVTEAVREYVGADALGTGAQDAVTLADKWTKAEEV